MAIQMTREEYEAKYGIKPFSGVSSQVAAAVDQQPGFFEGVSSAFERRKTNVDAAQATKQSGLSKVYQTLGQGAGLVGDVAFEGLKAVTPDIIEKPIGQAIGGVVQGVAQSAPAQNIMQGYQSWKARHPEAAANLEATGLLASVLPLGKAAQLGTKAIGSTAKVGAKAVSSINLGPSENSLITQRVAELDKLAANNAPIRKVLQKHAAKGVDSKSLLAQTDLLHGAVDETGTIRTANARAELNDFIEPYEGIVSQVLEREGVKIPLTLVQKRLTSAIDKSGLEGASLETAFSKLQSTMKGLARRADEDGLIPLQKIQDAKINAYSTIDYMNAGAKKADKTIARTFKELVEQNTKSADAAALNKELTAHFSVLDLLEKLDGKKVEGGKLGKYFAQTIGAVVGSHFGPLGAIAGAEIAGRVKGAALAQKFSGKTGATLNTSEAMQAAQKGSTPLQLPAYKSNSFGNRQTSQATTIAPIKNATPKSVPVSKKNASAAVPTPRSALKRPTASVDAKSATPTKGAWPTTASKPSKAGNTSTGSAPTGKEGVSAQKAGTSGPFDGELKTGRGIEPRRDLMASRPFMPESNRDSRHSNSASTPSATRPIHSTSLDHDWRTGTGDSKDAFVREIAYPADSIAERIAMLRKMPDPTLEDIKKFYNPSETQIARAKQFDIELPSPEMVLKSLQPKTDAALPVRAVFDDQTKGMMNSIRNIAGVKIGNVAWHSKPWKIVDTDNFDAITPRSYDANYKAPIAEFKTRDELWAYLRAQQTSSPSIPKELETKKRKLK